MPRRHELRARPDRGGPDPVPRTLRAPRDAVLRPGVDRLRGTRADHRHQQAHAARPRGDAALRCPGADDPSARDQRRAAARCARSRGLPRGRSPLHPDARRSRARRADADDGLARRLRDGPIAAGRVPLARKRGAPAMSRRLEVLHATDARGPDAEAIPATHGSERATRTLPAWSSLAAFYGGPLRIPLHDDRPTIVANFVSTLDGVVSFGDPGASGGSAVSGSSQEDHPLMGVLRTLGDAVMVGAGTVRRARDEEWTPRDIDPELAPEQARIRRDLGMAAQPTTVVVSASGRLDREQRGLASSDVPVLVATTSSGARTFGTVSTDERTRVAVLGSEDVGAEALVG